MKNRLQHIDIAKGIGILLVVFSHSWIVWGDEGELYNIIYSFHVPLFFFLSGVFLHSDKKISDFMKSRTNSLLKPYFMTMLFVCIAYSIVIDYPIKKFLVGMLYGNANTIVWPPLWFITHLWVVSLFSIFFIQITKMDMKPIKIRFLYLFPIWLIGVWSVGLLWKVPIYNLDGEIIKIFNKDFLLPGLPFSLDIVFISSFFFILGYILNDYVKKFQLSKIALFLALILFSYFHIYFNYTLDLASRVYDHWFISTAEALLGIYIVISISYLMSKVDIFVLILGKIGSLTLVILIFHSFIQGVIFNTLNEYSHHPTYFSAMTAFFGSILASLIIWYFIKSFKSFIAFRSSI